MREPENHVSCSRRDKDTENLADDGRFKQHDNDSGKDRNNVDILSTEISLEQA